MDIEQLHSRQANGARHSPLDGIWNVMELEVQENTWPQLAQFIYCGGTFYCEQVYIYLEYADKIGKYVC